MCDNKSEDERPKVGVALNPVVITGQEPLCFETLEEALKWFWRTGEVDAVLLVPPELKFKAREITHKIQEENPVSKCQFVVVYAFRSPSAWLLASKKLLEADGNK